MWRLCDLKVIFLFVCGYSKKEKKNFEASFPACMKQQTDSSVNDC